MFNRDLSKGSAELLVLTLLDARPRHGYDLGKLIEERTKGQIRFRIGSLYPILFRLEDRGLIAGRWLEKSGEPTGHPPALSTGIAELESRLCRAGGFGRKRTPGVGRGWRCSCRHCDHRTSLASVAKILRPIKAASTVGAEWGS